MSKNAVHYNKQDLFQSGKAYRSSLAEPLEGTFSDAQPYSNFLPGGGGYPGAGGYPGEGYQGGGYPGADYPGANLPAVTQPASTTPSSLPSFLTNLPVKDIKAFVDRMGGIDGIMSKVAQMNKVMQSFQQMAPMLKLLAGSFFSKTKNTNSRDNKKSYPRRRKRKRSRRKSGSRKYGRKKYTKNSARKTAKINLKKKSK